MQKFLCMPGNVLSERNAVVKTLTLTTGRNGKKKNKVVFQISDTQRTERSKFVHFENGAGQKKERDILDEK